VRSSCRCAILRHAQRLGWCDAPYFVVPPENPGRTRYLLPNEVERLLAAAAPHLRPLLTFLLGAGARMSEALELEWRDVDLVGAAAIFWRTKGGKRRVAMLPPRVVVALANLAHRDWAVFRWQTKVRRDRTVKRLAAYADHGRRSGGQIKKAFAGAIQRAGLDPKLTPHAPQQPDLAGRGARERCIPKRPFP
jgi:integrase